MLEGETAIFRGKAPRVNKSGGLGASGGCGLCRIILTGNWSWAGSKGGKRVNHIHIWGKRIAGGENARVGWAWSICRAVSRPTWLEQSEQLGEKMSQAGHGGRPYKAMKKRTLAVILWEPWQSLKRIET